MRKWIVLLAVVALWLAAFTCTVHSQTVVVPPAGAVVAPVAGQPAPVPAVKPAAGKSRLGLLERRKLGLTMANVSAACKELKASGEWDETEPAVNAAAVMKIIADKNPKAWADAKVSAGADWEAFFEQLLAFIEKLIALFSMFA